MASTPMLAATRLPPIIRDYGLRYTDVEVRLLDLRYAEALAAVDTGNADLAVVTVDGDDNRFHVHALDREDMVLVAPASHALASLKSVTLAQLASWPLLLIDQYEPLLARIAEEGKRSGVTVPTSTVVGNLTTMLGMVDAGLGVTLLPRSITRLREGPHAVIEVERPKLVRRFFVVRARKAKLGTAAASFIRFLRQAMVEGEKP